jgi:hypothetical protein
MTWIRRRWTPDAADHWSREDVVATGLSVVAYMLLLLGTTLSLLAMTAGYLLLAAGLLAAGVTYYIIDPKLRAVSTDYEKKQKEYLVRLEGITRWEEHQ